MMYKTYYWESVKLHISSAAKATKFTPKIRPLLTTSSSETLRVFVEVQFCDITDMKKSQKPKMTLFVLSVREQTPSSSHVTYC